MSQKLRNELNLMAKRELPPRNNRGKNAFYTTEIEKCNDEKTRVAPFSRKKTIKGSKGQEGEGKSLNKDQKAKSSQQVRRDLFNQNKKSFKYTRGIHYFYDLNKLQRASKSVSYAIFPSKKQQKLSKTNPYTITYSRESQIIGSSTISSLINRNYIGLPANQQSEQQIQQNDYIYNEKTIHQVIEMKRNDKNQCHHYLFEAEDKKHNLDRMIAQLRFVEKKIDYFMMPENLVKLKKFSLIEKDQTLSETFFQDNDLTNDEKKDILKDKISILQTKREKLNVLYENVSQTYYHNSLNQRLFNEIKKEKQKLNRFSIYQEIQKSIKQHQKQAIIPRNSVILENYLSFHQENSYSLQSEIDDYYCIDSKVLDPFIMENALKLISIRLFQEGQNCFYFAKKIFQKFFNRELKLEHQIRNLTFQQYSSKLKEIEEKLVNYWSKKVKDSDKKLSNSVLKRSQKAKMNTKFKYQTSKQSQKLRINQKFISIEFYEFHCLKLFESLYESLLIIKEFLQRNENKRINIVQYMASLYYPKLESKLVGIIQIPQFGLLNEALDKLVDVIMHPKKEFESMNYELYVQFIEKDKQVLTFLKEIQSPSCSDASSVFKRERSTSELESENQEIELEEELFAKGRKIVK